MKVIVSREASNGLIPQVGTLDRTVVSHYKTENGVRRFAKQYAKGKRFRIEFFHDDSFYGEPYRVERGVEVQS